MKSGNWFFDCCEASTGNQSTTSDEDERQDDAQHRADRHELHDAFHRRCSRTRRTPEILQARAPVRQGDLCALRYGTRDGHAPIGQTCTDSHEIRAPMRVCGPDHVLHSSDCSGRSRERAAGRASRVCDTCERPRGGPRGGRRGRRNPGGLGRRTTQGRARARTSSRPCAAPPRSRARRSPRRRRRTRSSRRASS